jgi:ABC-2 type transport system ATP-binding protein
MSIITVKNLSKKFIYHKKSEGLTGSLKALFWREKLEKDAVKDISFKIDKGEFVGFIGPNGAGKTTTLKILSGILYPTSGHVSVLGYTPADRKNEFKQKFSLVMGQKPQLWPTLPAIETFRLIQKIYEVPEKNYQKRLDYLAELMEVEDILNVQVRKLSLGQRMKCELIGALLYEPKILFLDEPTIGLDIISQKKIREFLREYNQASQTTIILTSHYMADVQDMCERLIVINEGQLGYDGSVKDIIARYSSDKTIKLVFSKKVAKKDLEKIGTIINYSGYEAELSVPLDQVNKKISRLVSKLPVEDISINSASLEEVIADLFKSKVD